MKRIVPLSAFALVFPFMGACGSRVSGHVYHNNGGVVQVEFRARGEAIVSSGPVSRPCSYSESGKSISLVCADSGATRLIIQDDGALVGPPQGLLSRLTPLEN